ncbi:MAG: ATP-binding protein [Prevotellaceae bacterium]|jgi:AAA15 family ATPase/GTPase|nr:ATP-binding protein [Prevotellaceae bacterium]
MILELKIKNFLSFKEEAIFSFEATRDKSFEDYQVVEVAPNTRILRLTLVYGANASGKSNLIKAFELLQHFWLNKPESRDELTGVCPFLLDRETPQKPSEFSLIFYVEGTRYLYSLALTEKKVISEKLFVYPGTQPALIFDRKLNDEGLSEIVFSPKRIKVSQAARDEITIKCLANMSVLAAYNQVNVAIPEVEKVVRWIKSQHKSLPVGVADDTESLIAADKAAKDFMLNFLQLADYNITAINTGQANEPTARSAKTEFEHRVVNSEGNEEFYKLMKEHQSEGTLRTLGLAEAIRKTAEANAFLAIDEIEALLHPRLVELVIEYFFKQKGQSQLLLTTHYDGLLEEDDLLRKDSIWFTNKKENGSTELYSLADFKGVNRISSLQKAYRHGRFGAVPNI